MFDSGHDQKSSDGINKENGDKKQTISIDDMHLYIKRMGERLESLEINTELQKKFEMKLSPLSRRNEREMILRENSYEKGLGDIFQDNVHGYENP